MPVGHLMRLPCSPPLTDRIPTTPQPALPAPSQRRRQPLRVGLIELSHYDLKYRRDRGANDGK